MSKLRAAITAVNGYVPEDVVTNFDLEKIVDTTDEWIRARTGIETRHILKGEGKGISAMAIPAVEGLFEKRGISAKEIDLLICASVTPDLIFPATANIICDKLGATNAWGYDLAAACSGFMFALETGRRFVESGQYKKVVIIGADKMSSIIDYEDRNTCIIFGDGCGAVLLEPTQEEFGIMDSILKVDGSGVEFLHQKAGGSAMPPSHKTVDERLHYVHQEGKTVFKFAVTNMAQVSYDIMQRNNLSSDDVNWLVPHQANKRIIDATADRMGLPAERVMVNIQKYGNTTSGTLPLCLWDYEKQLRKGDNIILAAFGGGFTWGAIYIK